MRIVLIVILSLTTLYGFSQEKTVTLSGKVLDENSAPLPYAKVYCSSNKKGVIANHQGEFRLEIPAQDAKIKVTFLGYESHDTVLQAMNTSHLVINFSLTPAVEELSAVTVTGDPYQKVLESYNLHIIDYTFFGQNILLLTDSKYGYEARLVDIQEKLLTKSKIPFKPLGFIKDCLGILHVIADDSLYTVEFNSEKFSFVNPITVETYVALIEPCVAVSDNYFFLRHVTNHFQSVQYISQRKSDNLYQTIHVAQDLEKIKDLNLYAQMLEEMRDVNMGGEINQITLGMGREKFETQTFFDNVLSRPAYAPLIKTDQAIYIFDHLADTCFIFDFESNLIDAKRIDYHLAPDWEEKLILDELGQRVYAVHQTNGIYRISEIDLESGELKQGVEMLEHTYPERIRIRDGWIYYLHHPIEKSGFNKLYRVKLPT